MRMRGIALCAILISAMTMDVMANENVKQEIIDRCRTQMGEYGASMVKACVDQDIEALNALNQYPEKHDQIISRCMRQMREYGFSMVKACADQDIEAEKALSNY